MRPLSIDLRERIVSACKAGELTQPQIADRFGVSLPVVKKLWRQWRETGDLSPRYKGRCSGKRKILPEHEERLRELVETRVDMTLGELRDAIAVDCTPEAVHYALKRMGITFKKRR